MEQNFADLLTDAFSDTSLPSFPEGGFDFEPLDFDEAKTEMSSGRLPVLREEEEDVDEGQEEEEPGGETGTVPDHISVKTYDVSLTEEDTQHIDDVEKWEEGKEEEEEDEEGKEEGKEEEEEEEEEGKEEEEEGEEEEEEEEEEGKEEEEEGEDEEEMDSGEEEDTGIEDIGSPGGRSVVVHYDEENIENIVTTGQPFAQEERENPNIRNIEQGAYENSDVSCFESVTEDDTMKITADISEGIEEEERPTAEENQEKSSDSDLEVLTSSITQNQREEGKKEVNLLSPHFPQENEEEEEQDEHGAPEMVSDCPDPAATQNLQSLMVNTFVEHPLEEKIKDFLGDDHQEAGESFADYPSDFSPSEYDKDGGKGRERNKNGSTLSSPSEGHLKIDENVYPEREITEQKDSPVQGEEDEKEDARPAISLSVEGKQDFADCAMCNINIDISMGKIIEDNLEADCSSDSSSDSSSDGSSEDEKDEDPEKHNEEHPALPRYQGIPQRDCGSDVSPLPDWEGGEENSSKQSVADLHLSDTISDVPTFTLHSEAGLSTAEVTRFNRGKRSTGNMSSSDSEDNFPGEFCTLETELRKDKGETCIWGKEEYLPEIPPELERTLENHLHTNISWDTGDNNVDRSGFILNYKYEGSGITVGEEQFADDEEEEERSWKQERVRIEAFYKFYNDEEEKEAMETEDAFSGRKPRVQFCMDPLPQVIEYTDSSDTDLVDSSSDRDEDLDSTARLEEQREPETQESQKPQGELQDLSKIPRTHSKRDRCLRVLKFLLKMALLTLIGLLTFWWTTDLLDLDW